MKNRNMIFTAVLFALASLVPLPRVQAETPAQEGGYPGGNTVTSTEVAGPALPLLTPNKSVFSYNLAPGANSAAHTVPANVPVLVMGIGTSLGYRGVGSATLLRITGSFIEWVGLESPFSAGVTSGYSGAAGTHIVYLDYTHQVDIEVNSPDTIRVHNASTQTRTGNVTLIW